MKPIKHISLFALLTLLLASCSMTKGLDEGQRLHYKTNYNFTNPEKVGKQGRVAAELTLIARPNPVSGLTKLQVALYNSVNKKGKEKGLAAWIKRKFGKAPVLHDEDMVERSRLVMQKYLQDIGYFGSTVTLDTVVNKKKVTVNYFITSKGQYFIREIYWPADTLPITHLLEEHREETLLEIDRPYNLPRLTAERNRLADVANNSGFFGVTKDNFYYFVDSTASELQADIYLRLKQTGDSSIYQVYYLDETRVYPDYSLEQGTASAASTDTISKGNLQIIQQDRVLRPSVLNRLVWQDSSSLFSKIEQSNTINRLLNLGIYKFANIRFEKEVRRDTHFLDRSVYLTPGLMRDLGLEFQVNSRSGNFLGTEITGSYSHKNLFKGAELFSLSLSTGLETNIGANAGSLINTLNINGNVSLQLPGIYAPFYNRKRVRGETLPRTAFSIGDDYQQRTGFFTLNSFNFSVGYNWRKSRWQHQFSPVFVNLVNLLRSSAELDEILATSLRLRSSFEDVLILGLSHRISFSNQATNEKGRYFFYRGGIETAGNLLNLTTGAFNRDGSREVAGIPFSQYVKLDNDLRKYFPLRKGMLAGRINIGVAYPYGNVEVLPYIKQYFIGGASSVRAFRIRTLGPGGYESRLDNDGSNFVDQTGDMKLEMNLEYRFPIIGYLKGALFADAGNIWLVRGDADESTPETDGRFQFDLFYKEIAIGTGFGLRVDFDVAVIRLDWAFPIRRPSQTDGTRWLFSEFDFLKRDWRRQNLVWNIAIGYPF